MPLGRSGWKKLQAWFDFVREAVRKRLRLPPLDRSFRSPTPPPAAGKSSPSADRRRPASGKRRRSLKRRRPRGFSPRPLVFEGLEFRRLFDSDAAVITGLITTDPLPVDEMTAYMTVTFTDTDAEANPPLVDDDPGGEVFEVDWLVTAIPADLTIGLKQRVREKHFREPVL